MHLLPRYRWLNRRICCLKISYIQIMINAKFTRKKWNIFIIPKCFGLISRKKWYGRIRFRIPWREHLSYDEVLKKKRTTRRLISTIRKGHLEFLVRIIWKTVKLIWYSQHILKARKSDGTESNLSNRFVWIGGKTEKDVNV